jgi:hypothetical protein
MEKATFAGSCSLSREVAVGGGAGKSKPCKGRAKTDSRAHRLGMIERALRRREIIDGFCPCC